MWIGTLDGLNRYDGYSFEIFNAEKNNPNSLNHSTVRSLAEDMAGRIWIGTDDGLNYYDQRKEMIYKIRINTTQEKLAICGNLGRSEFILLG